MILKYFVIFIIFSLFGWIYENIFFGIKNPDRISKKLFNMDLPILPIYGLAGVLLILIYQGLEGYSLLTKVIIAAILINLLGCGCSYTSYLFHGYQTWKYDFGENIEICNGYISITTAIIWTIFIFIFYKILDIFYAKKNI